MLNTSDPTVIVHIPVRATKVRFNGADVDCYELAEEFSQAQYADGEMFPISCPLAEWIMDVTVNAGVTPGTGNPGTRIYFKFVAAGPKSNEGQGLETADVTAITLGL